MDALTALLGREGFLPHGYCITWSPGLLWSMVGADVAIAAAYFSIPLAIVHFVRRRGDTGYNWVPWVFSAFIFACGLTHVMDAWTIWQPVYDLQVATKMLTAGLSIVTAVALWPLLPRALAIPSVAQLRAAIAALEAEVGRRRSAEEHLHDIEQSLAITLASIGAGFIATDRDGRITRMNAVAERLTGWSQHDAAGWQLAQVFVRDEPPAPAGNPVDAMLAQQLSIDDLRQMVLVARDGTRTPLQVQAALRRADDGTVRGLAMVFRDLSALRRSEEERSRLAALVESSNDAIIAKTLDGRVTSWNAAAESLFGYSAAEAIGQPVQQLIPAEHGAEEARLLEDLAQGRTVPPFDTVRLRKDGTPVEVSVTVSPIRDTTGRIVGSSKIARDISLQRAAEQSRRYAERLEAENRQIQEANRLKSQFLANMSHELRTPLNAIIGFADLLHTGRVPADSPKRQRFLEHIRESGRHLLQLINDVLDLSKVESGRFEFFPEPAELAPLLGELRNVLQTALERKGLQLEIRIDPDLTGLVFDPSRLRQALFNLLSNAIKFTAEGGHIEVRAVAAGPQGLRIEVQDDGIGIAAADLPRLFVDFQQLDAGLDKRHGGTGLGLALTRRLIEAQGGRVGVRSSPGRGSTFFLLLPRRPGAELAADDGRLLLIEPEPAPRELMRRALSVGGRPVEAAASADDALARADAHRFDAFTLGLRLPDRRGLALLADLRSRSAHATTPVLALTLPAAGETAGFAIADVLAKPIRSDEVVAAMARLPSPRERARRVMVVDDDPLALDLMRATLAALGIEALCLTGGREALDTIEQERPDALVLDLLMPGLDGFATLDALRRGPHGAALPVYIWTSLLLTEAEYTLLSRSAQAILGKGGGRLEHVLDELAHWRPAPARSGA